MERAVGRDECKKERHYWGEEEGRSFRRAAVGGSWVRRGVDDDGIERKPKRAEAEEEKRYFPYLHFAALARGGGGACARSPPPYRTYMHAHGRVE